jgi:hypothetical protein
MNEGFFGRFESDYCCGNTMIAFRQAVKGGDE